MKKSKILYWPGMGKDLSVLNKFRQYLNQYGFFTEIVMFEYDAGISPFQDFSSWNRQLLEIDDSWWIGISLGASLCYSCAAMLQPENRPSRITLINPFSSRLMLSQEAKFDIGKQWVFSPKDYSFDIDCLDVIISLNDAKISSHHGLDIVSVSRARNKKLILINSDHCITEKDAQMELVLALLNEDSKNGFKYICGNFREWK